MACCLADAPGKAETPLAGLTGRQLEACALRYYGDANGPMSYSQIAERLGISKPATIRLIRRGTVRIRANGYDVADLNAQAQ
jgi:DNA-binding CsgD family transcriptional regulator